MTSLLATLDTLLRADGRRRGVTWDDVLVHRNNGPLPSTHPGPDTVWNRGFDFLVLDGGRPTHFGRCRSADDARAGRASALRARLSEDPALERVIPATRFTLAAGLLVEVSRYVSGRLFLSDVAGLGTDALARDARRIIAAVRLVTSQADRAPAEQTRPRLELREAAGPALRFLAQCGMAPTRIAALSALLTAGGAVNPRAQHGDLWPANVLRCGGDFIVLDFEVFGEVQVPLYDVFHLLRSCLMLRTRPPGARPLIALLDAPGPDAVAWRAIVAEEAARDGLSREQAAGAFAFYLADMTATIRRRDTPEAYWGPYWRCLEALADRLAGGAPLLDLLLGPART